MNGERGMVYIVDQKRVGRTGEWRKRDGLYSGSEKSGKNSGGGQGLVRVKQEGHRNVHIR